MLITNLDAWVIVPEHDEYMVNARGAVCVRATQHVTMGGACNGYLVVGAGALREYVHRLICKAFHGIPTDGKHFVNHVDGDKHNNTPENLEWCTAQANSFHAWVMGLTDNTKSAVVWDVLDDRVHTFSTRGELAKFFGVANVVFRPEQFTSSGLYRRRYYLHDTLESAPTLDELRGSYIRVLEVTTGNETLHIKHSDAAKQIGVNHTTLLKFLKCGGQYLNGYLFKYHSDTAPWFTGERLQKAKNKAGIPVVIHNPETGMGYYAPNTSKAAEISGIPQFRIANCIRNNKEYLGDGFYVNRATIH